MTTCVSPRHNVACHILHQHLKPSHPPNSVGFIHAWSHKCVLTRVRVCNIKPRYGLIYQPTHQEILFHEGLSFCELNDYEYYNNYGSILKFPFGNLWNPNLFDIMDPSGSSHSYLVQDNVLNPRPPPFIV